MNYKDIYFFFIVLVISCGKNNKNEEKSTKDNIIPDQKNVKDEKHNDIIYKKYKEIISLKNILNSDGNINYRSSEYKEYRDKISNFFQKNKDKIIEELEKNPFEVFKKYYQDPADYDISDTELENKQNLFYEFLWKNKILQKYDDSKCNNSKSDEQRRKKNNNIKKQIMTYFKQPNITPDPYIFEDLYYEKANEYADKAFSSKSFKKFGTNEKQIDYNQELRPVPQEYIDQIYKNTHEGNYDKKKGKFKLIFQGNKTFDDEKNKHIFEENEICLVCVCSFCGKFICNNYGRYFNNVIDGYGILDSCVKIPCSNQNCIAYKKVLRDYFITKLLLPKGEFTVNLLCNSKPVFESKIIKVNQLSEFSLNRYLKNHGYRKDWEKKYGPNTRTDSYRFNIIIQKINYYTK